MDAATVEREKCYGWFSKKAMQQMIENESNGMGMYRHYYATHGERMTSYEKPIYIPTMKYTIEGKPVEVTYIKTHPGGEHYLWDDKIFLGEVFDGDPTVGIQ